MQLFRTTNGFNNFAAAFGSLIAPIAASAVAGQHSSIRRRECAVEWMDQKLRNLLATGGAGHRN